MSSNYPAGVSDSHEYFNPAPISANAVECGADEALVIPSYAVKAQLNDLSDFIQRKLKGAGDMPYLKETLESAASRVVTLQKAITGLEQEREYECPFSDTLDLEESECAMWVCPVCGNERETDTLPEDRDPDYDYDRRGDDD